MKNTTKQSLLIISLVFTIILVTAAVWGFSKEEVTRFKSPDGKYEAVIRRYRHLNLTFHALPGSGSDYPCFLSIYAIKSNKHMGTTPVAMACWAYGVVWTNDGAYTDARPGPEWNFKKNTCNYYDARENLKSGLK